MRCTAVRIGLSCKKCVINFVQYEDLVLHLYWRHGAESQFCPKCSMKTWSFAQHQCNVFPGHDMVDPDPEDTPKAEILAKSESETLAPSRLGSAVKRSSQMLRPRVAVKQIRMDDVNSDESESDEQSPQSPTKPLPVPLPLLPSASQPVAAQFLPASSSLLTSPPRTVPPPSQLYLSPDSQYYSDRESQYCYCGRNLEGYEMIGCDGKSCQYEWFHFVCVGIQAAPEGDWFCRECRKAI